MVIGVQEAVQVTAKPASKSPFDDVDMGGARETAEETGRVEVTGEKDPAGMFTHVIGDTVAEGFILDDYKDVNDIDVMHVGEKASLDNSQDAEVDEHVDVLDHVDQDEEEVDSEPSGDEESQERSAVKKLLQDKGNEDALPPPSKSGHGVMEFDDQGGMEFDYQAGDDTGDSDGTNRLNVIKPGPKPGPQAWEMEIPDDVQGVLNVIFDRIDQVEETDKEKEVAKDKEIEKVKETGKDKPISTPKKKKSGRRGRLTVTPTFTRDPIVEEPEIFVKCVIFSSPSSDHIDIVRQRLQALSDAFRGEYRNEERAWPVLGKIMDAAKAPMSENPKGVKSKKRKAAKLIPVVSAGSLPEEPPQEAPVKFYSRGDAEGPRVKVVEGLDWVTDKGQRGVSLICPGERLPR